MADVSRPISRILVANRGEIARRIIRTAHELGIGTVAVYADGDADAPFVREADTAIALGGRSSAETYLDVEKSSMPAGRAVPTPCTPATDFSRRTNVSPRPWWTRACGGSGRPPA